jgi:hypothetical protein
VGDPFGTTGETEILSGVGGISLNLFKIGPVQPYVTAGVGAFNMKEAFTQNGTTTSESNLRWGIDGGAGFTIKLGRIDAFLEGRVQNVYTESGAIDTKSIRSIPVTFGILF